MNARRAGAVTFTGMPTRLDLIALAVLLHAVALAVQLAHPATNLMPQIIAIDTAVHSAVAGLVGTAPVTPSQAAGGA